MVVKKTFRYSNGFFYNHLYHPELFYKKRYKFGIQPFSHQIRFFFTSGEFPASSSSSLSVISATSSLAQIRLSAAMPSRDYLSYITLKFP
jgi:hypothetical protein